MSRLKVHSALSRRNKGGIFIKYHVLGFILIISHSDTKVIDSAVASPATGPNSGNSIREFKLPKLERVYLLNAPTVCVPTIIY